MILFCGWTGAALLLGGAGIFTSAWEPKTTLGISTPGAEPVAVANLLSHIRFLRAIEFGFGLFCVVFRKEIFTTRVFNRLFVTVVIAGAGARALADGLPHWGFVAVVEYEVLTDLVFLAYSAREVER